MRFGRKTTVRAWCDGFLVYSRGFRTADPERALSSARKDEHFDKSSDLICVWNSDPETSGCAICTKKTGKSWRRER